MLKCDLTSAMAGACGSAEKRYAFVQSVTDAGPLICDDAEIYCVSDEAVAQHHVLAESAFFLSTELQDCGARAIVTSVTFQLNAIPTQRFEHVREE